METEDTFDIDIIIPKTRLPNGAYKGTIEKYEIKETRNNKKYIAVYVQCLDTCHPCRVNIFISDKNPQLAKLIVSLGWDSNGEFKGNLNPKLLIGREVYVKIIREGGYNGGDLQEFLYDFEYKAEHGIQPQEYDIIEVKKEVVKKHFVKLQDSKPQPPKQDQEEDYPPDFVDVDGVLCTYETPHPIQGAKMQTGMDEHGRRYYKLF